MRSGFTILIIYVFTACALVWGVDGDMGVGTNLNTNGSEAYPYLIEDLADFDTFADPNNAAIYWTAGVHTKLMTDIDLAGRTYTTAVIAPDPYIGTNYSGVFDGDGHTISNLTIAASSKKYIGLFGGVRSVGQIKNLGVENVYLSGYSDVGALVGWISYCDPITACYSTGSVNGEKYVGGLVGRNNGSTLTSCYSTCSISGVNNVGGLAGSGNGMVTCYSTGLVNGTGSYVGGLVGYTSLNTPIGCFWDIETSGQSGSAGGKGLTTEQMKTMSIYQNAGWVDKGWIINDGVDYPHLSWENTEGVTIPPAVVPFSGSGTAEDPYLISTPQEFALLSWYSDILDKSIELTTDLDLIDSAGPNSALKLYPIGDLGPFKGFFEGNNNIISNAIINQPGNNFVGIFAKLCCNGQIRNLGVEDINIIGKKFVGGLVGGNSNNSMITACYATGLVSGNSYVGGLLGENSYARLTASYATSLVQGESLVGGLVGSNNPGGITACYATGAVFGDSQVGGLAGNNYSSPTACYATGVVSGNSYVGGLVGVNYRFPLSACFWDIEGSGTNIAYTHYSGPPDYLHTTIYSTPGIAEGKTTAEMMMEITFTDAGWAFDPNDGDEADWMMLREGEDTPRLTWQEIFDGDIAGLYGVDMVDLGALSGCWYAVVDMPTELNDDGDAIVGLFEMARLGQYWLQTGCGHCGGVDTTGDGNVDADDLMEIAHDWLYVVNPECGRADIDDSGDVGIGDLVRVSEDWLQGL